ncbi:MAG: hypothetical protein HY902_06055 [Deltaproteobacteria bacterium]|nr:hypothetical protein [Deltaproteobacteria bacterium]
MATTRNHIVLLPTYIGAALTFVAFLFIGAVPGVLYGGYMGMTMYNVLFGSAGDNSWLARLVVGGGMGLGLAATLFFFLVAGAVAGTLLGLPFAPMLRRMSESKAAPEAQEALAHK